MYVSLLMFFAARPELGVAMLVVSALPVVVIAISVAAAAGVALFGGRERGARARLVLRDLLDALRRRGGRR